MDDFFLPVVKMSGCWVCFLPLVNQSGRQRASRNSIRELVNDPLRTGHCSSHTGCWLQAMQLCSQRVPLKRTGPVRGEHLAGQPRQAEEKRAALGVDEQPFVPWRVVDANSPVNDWKGRVAILKVALGSRLEGGSHQGFMQP